mmetsp:Transcript_12624/g.46633  ORF Transcript_12624/g.46633 Transcript_12624/m.46633 type:complete len:326 (+) Transcript_12624:227-1204(+)
MVAQHRISDGQSYHGFDHGHCPRQHARIVPALAPHRHFFSVPRDRLLLASDGTCGLERNAHNDGLAIADAALDPATSVGLRSGAAVLVNVEGIVVLNASELRPREAAADLEALRCREGHAGLRQLRLQLVEDGRSEARRDVLHDTFHDPANAIAALAHFVDPADHALSRLRVRTAHDIRLHILQGHRVVVDAALRHLHLSHGLDVSHDASPAGNADQLLRHRPSCHAADGFPRAAASATGHGANAILGVIRGICVRRPVRHRVGVVVLRALVLVPHEHADGSAQRVSVGRDARQDLHRVGLIPGRRQTTLAWTATVQLRLHLLKL